MSYLFYNLNYEVIAICKYESINLKKFCRKIYKIKKFSNQNVFEIINKIDPPKKKEILVGSGFAEIIDNNKIISSRKNLGNSFSTLKKINNPKIFFRNLNINKISFPKVSFKKPNNGLWLTKSMESYGGRLVKFQKNNKIHNKNSFYQEYQTGELISVQFFYSQNRLVILSVCSILTENFNDYDFLLKGIITKRINSEQLNILNKITKKICTSFCLNGINNIDFIVKNKDFKDLKIIEVNARPGLSTRLIFKKILNIFNNSFNQDGKFRNPSNFNSSHIIYSNKKFMVKEKIFRIFKKLSYSKKFSELPNENDTILKGEPICLLHLKAKTMKELKKKIEKYSDKIRQISYY